MTRKLQGPQRHVRVSERGTRMGRLSRYFRNNPGSLLIVVFQILLVSAAVLAEVGHRLMADEVAIYAFYTLVLGISVSVYSAIRASRKPPLS